MVADRTEEVAKLQARIDELEHDVAELEGEVRGEEEAEEDGRMQGDARTHWHVLERLRDVKRGLLTLDEYMRELDAENRRNFYGR